MAESPDAPRWELLPHDPVGFFQLADGFDRKDLKRAYNRLLRIFKPEKFPVEFQRIRAAYEELDEDLRYHGQSRSARIPVPQDWNTDAAADAPLEQAPAERAAHAAKPPAAKKRLVDRLADESPAALFNELQQQPHKSPYDYYALALLSDVVEKSSTGFARWLIEGIAAHPSDGALKQLLHQYFRGPTSAAALLKLLPLAARAVRTDEFYPLTEPAWQVVQQECTFDEFTATFDRCEAELRDSHIVGRMAFLIHMLKSGVWRDPQLEGWTARQFRFIEENFQSIPPWLEWDVELLGLAREYLAVRQQFASGSPLRTRMDAALKAYFSEPQEVGDREMVAAQMDILASGDALMDEFPIEEGELFSKFYPIWAWASHDVAERQSIAQEEVEVNENIWASRADALLGNLVAQGNQSWTGRVWSVALLARLGTLLLVFAGLTLLICSVVLTLIVWINHLFDMPSVNSLNFLGGFAGIALAIYGTVRLKGVIDTRLWFPLNGRFATKLYRTVWRRELLDFQRRSHVPDRFFRALFAHFADKSATSTWINEFVRQDYAPALLAGAQRYQA